MANGNHKKLYLLTLDLGEKVEYFRHIGIKTPDAHDEFFIELQKDLKNALQEALPSDIEVRAIHMRELTDDILSEAYKHKKLQDGSLIVSTCTEIAEPMHGVTLEINRIIDFDGVSIGFGPRPGYPSIDNQVQAIKRIADGRPVIIVEDGMWSGSTMHYIVKKLIHAGLKVDVIIVGFMFPNALSTIGEIESLGVEVSSVEEFNDHVLEDWVPDHDFFPFIPNCGRLIGIQTPNGPQPYYDHNGLSYSAPYFRPFSPMTDWASIPTNSTSALSLKAFEFCERLYTKLEQLNGRKITVKELSKGIHRGSVPYILGKSMPVIEPHHSAQSVLFQIEHDIAVFELRKPIS